METFGTVWNIGNCEHITLQKDMENCRYETLSCKLPRLDRVPLLIEVLHWRILSAKSALGHAACLDSVGIYSRARGAKPFQAYAYIYMFILYYITLYYIKITLYYNILFYFILFYIVLYWVLS